MRATKIPLQWLAPVVLALALLPVGARASEDRPPPCADDVYHAFDFWLGEWVVHTASGELAGRNSIRARERACLLVESWRGAQGGTGTSLNFVEPDSGRWRQIWVSANGTIDISGGLQEEGSMVLDGTIVYRVGEHAGREFPFRGTWTPLPDGRVRQFFEEARVDGDWKPWFEGFYSRDIAASDQSSD